MVRKEEMVGGSNPEDFEKIGEKKPKLKSLPYFSSPTAYFIKGE